MFVRLQEFIAEESKTNQWAYATIQCWTTFTHHLTNFNSKVTFDFFNETGINKFVVYLRNKCGLEKPVIFLTKEELLHLYHFQIPKNGTKVKLLDMNGKGYEKTVEDAGGCYTIPMGLCYGKRDSGHDARIGTNAPGRLSPLGAGGMGGCKSVAVDAVAATDTVSQRRVAIEVAGLAVWCGAQRRTKLTDEQVPLPLSALVLALSLILGTIGPDHQHRPKAFTRC